MGVGDVTKPKLSIIIPVYNTEKYLAACLDSVVGQSWDNLEVLIVDDCTPDHAMEIAEDYAERYPFIRILHHPENRGLFRARITGMEAMTGDYFAFLDSDDTVTLDYYRPMIKKAMETTSRCFMPSSSSSRAAPGDFGDAAALCPGSTCTLAP